MKRRNFLSGLMAAPLALKARFLGSFARKPIEQCGARLVWGFVFTYEPFYRCVDAFEPEQPTYCSLPRHHDGIHGVLLNQR